MGAQKDVGKQDSHEDLRARCWRDQYPPLDHPVLIQADVDRRMSVIIDLTRLRSGSQRFIRIFCSVTIRRQSGRLRGVTSSLPCGASRPQRGATDQDINWPTVLDICTARAYLHIYDVTHISEVTFHAV